MSTLISNPPLVDFHANRNLAQVWPPAFDKFNFSQNFSTIRCCAACLETKDCHGYHLFEDMGVCHLYIGIKSLVRESSSSVMVGNSTSGLFNCILQYFGNNLTLLNWESSDIFFARWELCIFRALSRLLQSASGESVHQVFKSIKLHFYSIKCRL